MKWEHPNMMSEVQKDALPRLKELMESKRDIEELDRNGMIVIGTPMNVRGAS